MRIFAPQTRHHFRFCQRQQKYLQIFKLNQNIFKYWAGKQCCPAHLCHWSKSNTERAKRISSEPSFLCFHLLPLSTTAAYLEASSITNLPKCLRNPLMFANDIFATMYHDCHSWGTIVHMQRAIRNCRTRVDHQKSLSKCQQQFLQMIICQYVRWVVASSKCNKFKFQEFIKTLSSPFTF